MCPASNLRSSSSPNLVGSLRPNFREPAYQGSPVREMIGPDFIP